MKPKIWRRRAEPEKKLHPESAELESEERVEGLGRGLWIQGREGGERQTLATRTLVWNFQEGKERR